MKSVLIDEAATWAEARAGDPASFGLMFDAHRDRVFGQALRLIRSPHDAEDVTALVFLEVWRKRDTVRVVDGSIIGWLLVTTNNVSRNFARTLRRYHAVIDRLPAPTVQADHADAIGSHLDARTRAAQVQDAFTRLSKKDQDIITLCVLEELTTPQAAEALGIPVGTVKSRLSRAKQRLSTLTNNALSDNTIISGGAQ